MRHKLNLPDQPNVIFLVIVFDLLALVGVYGVYGSNWVGKTGYEMELSSSSADVKLSENYVTLRIFDESDDFCILAGRSVKFSELTASLAELQESILVDQVLLMVDSKTSVAKERRVLAILEQLDLECVLVTEGVESND